MPSSMVAGRSPSKRSGVWTVWPPARSASANAITPSVRPWTWWNTTTSAMRLLLGCRLQGGDERLLRHFDAPDHLHPPLALFLLLEELALAGDVTAVTLREHVLADRADVLARDDSRADGGLDRHFELLPWDEFAQLRRHRRAVGVGLVLVHDRGKRINRLALQQDVDLHEVGGLLPRGFV